MRESMMSAGGLAARLRRSSKRVSWGGRLALVAAAASALWTTTSSAQVASWTIYEVNGYKAFKDSPFYGLNSPNNFVCGYFHFENFEDGALSTPGVTANTGLVGSQLTTPGMTVSVDEDDESLTADPSMSLPPCPTQGSGLNGKSWFVNNGAAGVVFHFDPGVLGGYPTHVGIVFTDGPPPPPR